MSGKMSQHPVKHPYKAKFLPWKCHYCGRYGHKKSCCFRLYGYPKHPTQPIDNHVTSKTRKEWKSKVVNTSPIAHTSLRVSSRED